MLDILKVFALIVVVYFAYQLALKHTGFLESSAPEPNGTPAPVEEGFMPPYIPVPTHAVETPKPLPEEKIITPAGPNPPAQKAPDGVRHVMADEQPVDPFAETEGDAYEAEKLRNPERMFRPAPENNNTSIAAQGGIASTLNAVPQHVGQFAPEMAQNGGFFMDSVAANDLEMHVNFSEY
jgi:hypothetical protein